MVNVYVLNKDGSPLMPIHSYGRAKRLLKSGKARIASTRPFTVQLKEQIDNPVLEGGSNVRKKAFLKNTMHSA